MRLNVIIFKNVHKSANCKILWMSSVCIRSQIRAVFFHMAATWALFHTLPALHPIIIFAMEPPPYFREHRLSTHLCVSVFLRYIFGERNWTFSTYGELQPWTFVLALRKSDESMSFPEDTADYIYFHLFLKNCTGRMSREWNRDVDTVGISVKARANNWYLYLNNCTSGLLIELKNHLIKYNAICLARLRFCIIFNINVTHIFILSILLIIFNSKSL